MYIASQGAVEMMSVSKIKMKMKMKISSGKSYLMIKSIMVPMF